MATKALTIVLTCCAGAVAAVIGWQLGDDLFANTPATEHIDDAPGQVSVLVKSLPSANRDVKRDRADAVALPGGPPQLRMSLTDNPDTRAEFSPMPSFLPPPMVPRPMGKMDKPSRAYLNDAQLAAIKQRLRLTKAQEKSWQPVEAALRGMTQQIADFQNRAVKRNDFSFDVESAEIQQLKAVGKPFLAQLRDDQKAQVRMLATMAGLGPMMASFTSEKEDATGEN